MSVDLLELTPPPVQRKQVTLEPVATEPPPAQTTALAEYIIEGDQPAERYFLHDSTMPIKLHTDGTVELGLTLDSGINRANKERFEQVRHTLPRKAPVVQLYHPSPQEVVAETREAMMPHNRIPLVIIPVELRTAYNDKLAEYKGVSAKLLRHKFMSVAVLELTTERFMDLIQELSVVLNEVDAIREHTLEEAIEGFAV